MKKSRILQPALACLTACAVLAQQGKAPEPAAEDEEDTNPVVEEYDWTTGRGVSRALMERLDLLVPPGRAHEGLSYPVFTDRTEKGPPFRKSLFKTTRMLRMDASHLRFKEAVFSSFDDRKSPETATRTVKSADLIYDLVHDFIFTNTPIQIDDRDLSIHSGAMLHDRATGLTIFSGGVSLYFAEPVPDKVPAATPPPAPSQPTAAAPSPAKP